MSAQTTAAGGKADSIWSLRTFPVLHPKRLRKPRSCHRPRDGSVVSSLHYMNDPQPEGHMASYIRRRKFLATLGGAVVARPLAARAQQPGNLPTIGLLGATTPAAQSQLTAAFMQRLREL